ncbi:hypothetical protein PGT21_025453 [Puccinia graminis f. sp. tritici]|uniref:VPS9 domain-containing protein n=1 Tax=Puccinia graminis f. sp. tritici TaxID=56615 RepID=A0A5B0NZ45_PUCGR|nr:hypothetical protein PGT21_025453 [Puccinia graminis f. sp. tritici]KAA1129009.1 hypothetical protein PGTUg99_022415 [Puccinia graminis f. sp. tritici]
MKNKINHSLENDEIIQPRTLHDSTNNQAPTSLTLEQHHQPPNSSITTISSQPTTRSSSLLPTPTRSIPSIDSLPTTITTQSTHTIHFPTINPDHQPKQLHSTIRPSQSSLPPTSQPLIQSLEPSTPSQESDDMTPAQKIARQVRISFSIAQPPPVSSSPTKTTITHHETEPKTTPSSALESLTPAQVVAQQARQMDSQHPDQPTSKSPSKPQETTHHLISNPVGSLPSQEPASFRVISGRKGLPGDGQDMMAVVRPPPDSSLAPDRPPEPKIVKRTSKLGMSSQVSSILSASTDLTPSVPAALHTPSTPLPSNVTNPNSVPSTTPSIPSHVPQALPSATSSASPTSPPVIPVAIFPTYSDEDDNGSLEYSDGGHEVDSAELEPEEETDEEEDYDSNPLYIVLSTSLSPRLKNAYDSAKLVLLPTRRALPLDMPRKLPDPTLEFESEWEQWIAAHTFVSASESTNPVSGGSLTKDPSKEGIEWVGITSMKDKQVNLYLKPGTGVAEVRLTYTKAAPLTTPNNPILTSKSSEPVAQTDFSPIRPTLEGDPHRTIRAKVGPDDADYGYHHPSTFGDSLTSPLPTNNPSPGISIERPQLPGSKTSPAVAAIIRSPSTATESSLAFTQSSSGVSRASSEGWSDMPVTPPNLLTSMAPPSRSGVCKSHLSNTLKGVENSLDDSKSALPLGPALTAPLLNPISLPSTTVTKIQTAKIVSEETMYRSPSAVSQSMPPKSVPHGHETSSTRPTPSDSGLESALSGSKAKKGKEVEQRLRFKAPKWLRPGAAQKEKEKEKERREKAAAVALARLREEQDRELSLMTRTGTKLERVRLISLKSPVIECWWQSSVIGTDQTADSLVQEARQEPQEPCKQCEFDNPPRTGGIFPFPRARTSTVTSCTEHRRTTNRSSASLSQRSTLSSTYHSQSMGRRSSSILLPEDDRSSRRSSTRRESTKRRSRRMPSGLSILRHSGTNKYRSIFGDFAFLLSPPEEFGAITCGILRKSVSKIWMHCHRFCETVVFLKGFENYMVSQLKNEIFEPITHDIREDLKKHGHATVDSWGSEDWERLTNLVENVLFAFLHPTLYSRGLSCHYASEDDYLDSILHGYRKRRIPLSEFEIELPAALQDESLLTEAVEKLNELRAYEGAYSSPSPLSPEILQRLFVAMDTVDEQTVLNVLMAKTPLECISIIKQTIDILVSVWTDVSTQAGMDEEARRLTPDDLLALLASVIVRSGIQQQHSLIQYTKVFRLSGSLTPETDWAFVSYQAAIAYLQSDPFSVLDSQSVRSQTGSVRSMPPHSPSLASTWARRRPVSFTPPTTSSNAITISARSSPSGSRLSLTDHIQPRTAPPYTPTIYSNHRQSSRANLLMRSHNPTSSLALVDPPSVRLEVTSARHDHSRSVDCLHTHTATEAPQFSSSSRKLILTRPTLTPISTVDRSARRIDTAMLSAPMIDGGFGRSCSNPWDSSRSLSSIGEIVTDPSSSMGSTIKQSESPHHHHHHHHHHHQHPATMMRSSLSSQSASIPNRSFHHPFSNGIEVQAGNSSSSTSPPRSDKNTSPVLSRRKTVDWAGMSFAKPFPVEGGGDSEEYDRLGASQRSSKASLSLLGSSIGGGGRLANHHGRSGSLTTKSEFGIMMEKGAGAGSDLRLHRTMTGSSLGPLSSSLELPSQDAQQQSSEGWLEWGRKRLTSVTSLNLAGPDLGRPSTRRGSISSASTRPHELSSSLHHRPSAGQTMSPAMEALSRARAASSLSIQRPPSSSSSTISLLPRERGGLIEKDQGQLIEDDDHPTTATNNPNNTTTPTNTTTKTTPSTMIPLQPIFRKPNLSHTSSSSPSSPSASSTIPNHSMTANHLLLYPTSITNPSSSSLFSSLNHYHHLPHHHHLHSNSNAPKNNNSSQDWNLSNSSLNTLN